MATVRTMDARTSRENRSVETDALGVPGDLSLVPLRLRLVPRGQWRVGPAETCSEQFVYVIRGTVQALSYGTWVPISAGESVSLRGEGPQIWRNDGEELAEMLLVCLP